MASESAIHKILQSIDLEDLVREVKDYALLNGKVVALSFTLDAPFILVAESIFQVSLSKLLTVYNVNL